ncbi:hypothetical protein [Vibrio phage VP4B]|uniref:Uncharacterized protein n=1 Tax=Vibrio phage VP4B TaxID=1262540 RepID=V9M0V3_9CAUD|nr:hypothetical protein FDJ61_gp204 [Vibrio phage VP4B]AGB07318.1 hypothetical protein [Vibrio phage VP4B]
MKIIHHKSVVEPDTYFTFQAIDFQSNPKSTINVGIANESQARHRACSVHRYPTANGSYTCFLDTRGLKKGDYSLQIWPSSSIRESQYIGFTIGDAPDTYPGLTKELSHFYAYLLKWCANLEEQETTLVTSHLKFTPTVVSDVNTLLVSPSLSRNFVELSVDSFNDDFESLLRLLSAHYGEFRNMFDKPDFKELSSHLTILGKINTDPLPAIERFVSIFPNVAVPKETAC